ncbi:hypothetical protein EXIGLDRAFT_723168 [Exidia glandulosa HHB12029]|uniref:Uncharacterized protein n=1 Tax=Exidia glandulosa HHB12029 TaxID=1314781 RepID=A0A165N032_EXIGL|nr:hypothetical protein EXIGLDRAFT_723168 [Exidia glandulosa HHB12029]
MYFFLSAFASLFALAAILVWRQRAKIAPLVPPRVANRLPYFRHYAYSPLPGSSFADQAAGGLSSSTFDLEGNIFGGDSRVGLDEHGAAEVNDIMRREHVSFDQARVIRQQRYLARNGIDPSGMPLDSKAITRL